MAGAGAKTSAMSTPTVDPETAQAVKVFADRTRTSRGCMRR